MPRSALLIGAFVFALASPALAAKSSGSSSGGGRSGGGRSGGTSIGAGVRAPSMPSAPRIPSGGGGTRHGGGHVGSPSSPSSPSSPNAWVPHTNRPDEEDDRYAWTGNPCRKELLPLAFETGVARLSTSPMSPTLRVQHLPMLDDCFGVGWEAESLTAFGGTALPTTFAFLDAPGSTNGVSYQQLGVGPVMAFHTGPGLLFFAGSVRFGAAFASDGPRPMRVGFSPSLDVRLGSGPVSFDWRWTVAVLGEDTMTSDLGLRLRVRVQDASVFVGWRLLEIAPQVVDAEGTTTNGVWQRLASGPEAGLAFGF